MMNYGISPGGGYAYQMPVNGYTTNQGANYGYNQSSGWTTPQNVGWGQPQVQYMQSSMGYNNYQTPNVGYSQPLNQAYQNVQPYGWINSTQWTPQVSHQQQYHSYNYGVPYFGKGCGNCGTSVPTIRRDW